MQGVCSCVHASLEQCLHSVVRGLCRLSLPRPQKPHTKKVLFELRVEPQLIIIIRSNYS